MNSSVQDQFYREVSCLLVGSRQKRKGFLQDLRNDLNAYCTENPNADRSAISDHFGEPQELAAEFLSGHLWGTAAPETVSCADRPDLPAPGSGSGNLLYGGLT